MNVGLRIIFIIREFNSSFKSFKEIIVLEKLIKRF